jgi:hypothetical protein
VHSLKYSLEGIDRRNLALPSHPMYTVYFVAIVQTFETVFSLLHDILHIV